jgi:hypothetical protein
LNDLHEAFVKQFAEDSISLGGDAGAFEAKAANVLDAIFILADAMASRMSKHKG